MAILIKLLVWGFALLGGLMQTVHSPVDLRIPHTLGVNMYLSPSGEASNYVVPRSQVSTTVTLPTPISPTSSSPASATQPGFDISRWLPSNSDEVGKAILTAILSVLGTLLVVFFSHVAKTVQKAGVWLWGRLRIERTTEERYRKRVAKELQSVQILRMAEAKELETIFIPLRLYEWISPGLLERTGSTTSDYISLSEALNRFERITVVGDPGAGKTTLTSHVAAAVADRALKICGKEFFPIFIQLRRLKEFLDDDDTKGEPLLNLLVDALERFGFSGAQKFIERKLTDGRCMIILDGFDELADKSGILQQRLANKLSDFIVSIPSTNRIVLTSREAGYEPAWFAGFQVLAVTDLTIDQIKQFIAGWFGLKQREQGSSLQMIIEGNERLQLLTANPLMLAIVCFVYATKNVADNFLPQKRADLYDECIEALTSKWDMSRGINRKPLFTPKQIEVVLSHVAYEMLLQERIDCPRRDLLTLIRTYMNEADLRKYDDEAFLNEVLEHTGLFKEKAHDTIGFLHLTFHEYLAARVIAEKVLAGIERNDLGERLMDLTSNISNPLWKEPITLAAGILRGRTELFMFLYNEYSTRADKHIQLLLAGCLRDADLSSQMQSPDYLIAQDDILSNLVAMSTTQDQTI